MRNSYVVRDSQGDVYAIRSSYPEAVSALADGESYIDDAATCGHPLGARWASRRFPFSIEVTNKPERLEEILADGTPILDREP